MVTELLRRVARGLKLPVLADFAIPSTEAANVASRIDGDLAGMFFAGRGRTVHKWLHYLEIYERYFAKYRGTPVRMLEIGVSEGGSLDLWREYFGRDAVIFGIDVNPDCAGRVTAPNQVRIGSQDDPAFLCSVVDEMGPPDIILDDGSHVGRHQRTSFDTLFPLLADGGLYVIEDMHTSYWPDYEGGYRRAGTAVEFLKQMVDDLHGWYHRSPRATPARDWIKAMHVYDSIVVIEKGKVQRPGHIQIR